MNKSIYSYSNKNLSNLLNNLIKLSAIFISEEIKKKFAELSPEELNEIQDIKSEISKYFTESQNPESPKVNRIVDIEGNVVERIGELEKEIDDRRRKIRDLTEIKLDLQDSNASDQEIARVDNQIRTIKREIQEKENNLQKLKDERFRDRREWLYYNFSKKIEPEVIKKLLEESKALTEEKIDQIKTTLTEKPDLLPTNPLTTRNPSKRITEEELNFEITHRNMESKVQNLISKLDTVLGKIEKEFKNPNITSNQYKQLENLYRYFKTSKIIMEQIYQNISEGYLSTITDVYESPKGYQYTHTNLHNDVIQNNKQKIDELLTQIDLDISESESRFEEIKNKFITTKSGDRGLIGYIKVYLDKNILANNNIDVSLLPSNLGTEWSLLPEYAMTSVGYGTDDSDDFYGPESSYSLISGLEKELERLNNELIELENQEAQNPGDQDIANRKTELQRQIDSLQVDLEIQKQIADEDSADFGNLQPQEEQDQEPQGKIYKYLIEAFIPESSIDWDMMESEYKKSSAINEVFVKENHEIYVISITLIDSQLKNTNEDPVYPVNKTLRAYQIRTIIANSYNNYFRHLL